MHAKQAQKLEDWTEVPLDDHGKQIQEEMTKKFQVYSPSLFQYCSLNTDPFR